MSFVQYSLECGLSVQLNGILYFEDQGEHSGSERQDSALQQSGFITDNVENIVPEFLTLLHGVIDSPDIPLNVSRSYLQSDHNVQKISNHISKKISDKLKELFNAVEPILKLNGTTSRFSFSTEC